VLVGPCEVTSQVGPFPQIIIWNVSCGRHNFVGRSEGMISGTCAITSAVVGRQLAIVAIACAIAGDTDRRKYHDRRGENP
jgi:hypothetical protein